MSRDRIRARKIRDGYYEVTEGDKWWTVAHIGFQNHLITNSRGQVVPSNGPTGKRVIAAILDREGP